MGFGNRLRHALNVFLVDDDVRNTTPFNVGSSSSSRPDRPRVRIHSERTIVSSIYTRMSIDVAGYRMEHVQVDEEGQYLKTINSGLNQCLNVEANIDQGGRHFRQDIPFTLFTEGCIAIIAVETNLDPRITSGYDIRNVRVGTILDWFPDSVRVRAYNEKTGLQQDLVLPKSMVAIVENPFYSVMNEPNSTLQRLVHKLSLLDNVDEIASSGKLDIIIQLPYVVKSETRKSQAIARTEDIKSQLKDSTYGIAYTDGTEKITQLNRSVENNLLEQVKYLKEELFNELGLTPEVMNGTADDVVMLNYKNRTLEPILDAIIEAMIRTFLTKTARTQGQTMMYFQNPFKTISVGQFAELADVLSRNQIASPNELRQPLGLKPSKSPQANSLVNSNMPLDKQLTDDTEPVEPDPADAEEAALDKQMAELGL